MRGDDDFVPHLGRPGSGTGRTSRYLHSVLAAANLAGAVTRPRRGPAFNGCRLARGSGIGRVLAQRGQLMEAGRRGVVVKVQIVRLAGRGRSASRAHIRYLEREGVTREHARGRFYDADGEVEDRTRFQARQADDRHEFRIIISPEDGREYDSLEPLTRRLMARAAADLGTDLDWIAVDHFNTAHPHTHVNLRGRDQRNRDLVIAPDYLAHGLRERTRELVELDLGPAPDHAPSRDKVNLRARLTRIDRSLLDDADDGSLAMTAATPRAQSLFAARLRMLEHLGLARPITRTEWRLDCELEPVLDRIRERLAIHDALEKTLPQSVAPIDRAIYEPGSGRVLVGRIIAHGQHPARTGCNDLIIEAVDGRAYHVDIGLAEPAPGGAIVRIAPWSTAPQAEDLRIAEVARRNAGIYDVEMHRRDAAMTDESLDAHIRRLEALGAACGLSREGEGRWSVPDNFLERVGGFEASRSQDHPVTIAQLSHRPLAALVHCHAWTWLDAEIVAHTPLPLRDAGFGRDVLEAIDRRREWLVEQGLARRIDGRLVVDPDMAAKLGSREIAAAGAAISRRLGIAFTHTRTGDTVEGTCREAVDLVSGRFAVLERAGDFSLVPWRPILEHRIGHHMSGVMIGDSFSWTIGRGRSAPSID